MESRETARNAYVQSVRHVGETEVQQMRVVLLGESAVGKSSIALRFKDGTFTEGTVPTIGAAFIPKTIDIDGVLVKLDIWDTAGQERFRSLTPMYYRRAQAAIVVYDITNSHSFQEAHSWVNEIRRETNTHVLIALAGNKADMATYAREVTKEEGIAYSQDNDLIFVETSAKTGLAIQELFRELAKALSTMTSSPEKGVRLADDKVYGGRTRKCPGCF